MSFFSGFKASFGLGFSSSFDEASNEQMRMVLSRKETYFPGFA